MKLKACVITFLGSNCNTEASTILNKLGFEVLEVFCKDGFSATYKPDLIFIPGGFSYGDYLRSGAIAAVSNIAQDIQKFAENGIHIVGVCNGFQILCEMKLLDGVLLKNNNSKFICCDTEIITCGSKNNFYSYDDKQYLMQIAHGDGRYFNYPDKLKKLEDGGNIAFKYKKDVNGSVDNIAGIFGGKNRNILGMMPHPERLIANGNGYKLFENLFTNLK
jgi:phosphoribosylformylglycinamidine synthase